MQLCVVFRASTEKNPQKIGKSFPSRRLFQNARGEMRLLALSALAEEGKTPRRSSFPADRSESTLISHWEIYPALLRCSNQPGPEMDPSQDNPIKWRTRRKSLPGKMCDLSRTICARRCCKMGLFKALNAAKRRRCFFQLLTLSASFWNVRKLTRFDTKVTNRSPKPFLSFTQHKYVFFRDPESFWIINF